LGSPLSAALKRRGPDGGFFYAAKFSGPPIREMRKPFFSKLFLLSGLHEIAPALLVNLTHIPAFDFSVTAFFPLAGSSNFLFFSVSFSRRDSTYFSRPAFMDQSLAAICEVPLDFSSPFFSCSAFPLQFCGPFHCHFWVALLIIPALAAQLTLYHMVFSVAVPQICADRRIGTLWPCLSESLVLNRGFILEQALVGSPAVFQA